MIAKELPQMGESVKQFYVVSGGKESIVTCGNDDVVQQANYEDRKSDGFSGDRSIRRVARIYMPTVRFLAAKGDYDAALYYHHGDTQARDRMINRHPLLFKACSGGT